MSLPACASARNLDPAVWSALKNSIYPGAQDESVAMVVDYCAARGLDPLLKPVHIVPMYIEDRQTGQKSQRDVVMPGIGLYRIQADRSGSYAGMDPPRFGPDIEYSLGTKKVVAPEWCEVTVHKLIGDRVVAFTCREYWIENYASKKRDDPTPNSMWEKRPRGQIVKCATAQALRAGWPEIGSQPTADEMEGKDLEIDVTPKPDGKPKNEKKLYPQDDFDRLFSDWAARIQAGTNTAERIITMISSKGELTEAMKQRLRDVNPPIQGELQ